MHYEINDKTGNCNGLSLRKLDHVIVINSTMVNPKHYFSESEKNFGGEGGDTQYIIIHKLVLLMKFPLSEAYS